MSNGNGPSFPPPGQDPGFIPPGLGGTPPGQEAAPCFTGPRLIGRFTMRELVATRPEGWQQAIAELLARPHARLLGLNLPFASGRRLEFKWSGKVRLGAPKMAA